MPSQSLRDNIGSSNHFVVKGGAELDRIRRSKYVLSLGILESYTHGHEA
jgi:hypothetical protein